MGSHFFKHIRSHKDTIVKKMSKAQLEQNKSKHLPIIYAKHPNNTYAFAMCLHCRKGARAGSNKYDCRTFVERYVDLPTFHKECKYHYDKYHHLFQCEPVAVNRTFSLTKIPALSETPVNSFVEQTPRQHQLDNRLKDLLARVAYKIENGTLRGFHPENDEYDEEFVMEKLQEYIDSESNTESIINEILYTINEIRIHPDIEYTQVGNELGKIYNKFKE